MRPPSNAVIIMIIMNQQASLPSRPSKDELEDLYPLCVIWQTSTAFTASRLLTYTCVFIMRWRGAQTTPETTCTLTNTTNNE